MNNVSLVSSNINKNFFSSINQPTITQRISLVVKKALVSASQFFKNTFSMIFQKKIVLGLIGISLVGIFLHYFYKKTSTNPNTDPIAIRDSLEVNTSTQPEDDEPHSPDALDLLTEEHPELFSPRQVPSPAPSDASSSDSANDIFYTPPSTPPPFEAPIQSAEPIQPEEIPELKLEEEETSAPYSSENCLYAELTRTTPQEQALDYIVPMISQGMIKAGVNRSTLEERGQALQGMHPLRHLGYVVSHHKAAFQTIYSMYSWNPIRSSYFSPETGLANALQNRADAHRLTYSDHIQGFALETGKDAATIQEICDTKNWEALFCYLAE